MTNTATLSHARIRRPINKNVTVCEYVTKTRGCEQTAVSCVFQRYFMGKDVRWTESWGPVFEPFMANKQHLNILKWTNNEAKNLSDLLWREYTQSVKCHKENDVSQYLPIYNDRQKDGNNACMDSQRPHQVILYINAVAEGGRVLTARD